MKVTILIICWLAILSTIVNGQVLSQGLSGGNMQENVQIVFTRVTKSDSELKIEAEVVNRSAASVFLLVEPRTYAGRKSLYISCQNDAVLELSSQFYDSPKGFVPVFNVGVRAKELSPGSKHFLQATLSFPLYPTLPPCGQKSSNKPIRIQQLTAVSLTIGVLPFDSAIREILTSSDSRPSFDGYLGGGELVERGVFQGKELAEIQFLVSSTYSIPQR